MSKKIKFKYYPIPFQEHHYDKSATGSTWGELLTNSGMPLAPYMIIVDDKKLFYPECKDEKIGKHKFIKVILYVENSKAVHGYFKNIATIGMIVVGTILTIIPGTQFIGIPILIGVGIGAMSAAFAPGVKKPAALQTNKPGENKYSISGAQNVSQIGAAFPYVCGKTRVVPPYVANYYVTMDDPASGDGKQYLHALLNVGYKSLSVKNIKIGNLLVASNTNDVRNGSIPADGVVSGSSVQIQQNGTVPTLYGSVPVSMSQVGVELKQADGLKYIYTSPRGTTKINCAIRFDGLAKQNSDGGLDSATVALKFWYRKNGSGDAWVQAVYEETINAWIVDKQVIDAGDGKGDVDLNIPKQTIIAGQELECNLPYVTTRVNGATLQAKVYHNFLGDYVYYDLVANGISLSGSSSGDTFTKSTNSVQRFMFQIIPTQAQIDANPDGIWDVCVSRETQDERANIVDRSYWESVIFYESGAFMNQKQLDKVCLLALKIEANALTQGNLDKVSVIAQSVLPVWTGTEWTTSAPVPTSNPAAIYLGMLKSAALINPESDELIDYPAIQALYDFCVAKNYECNFVIAEQERLFDLIQTVLATSRSEFYLKDGQYSVVIDDVKPTPVAILTPRNTYGFQMTRNYGKPINAYSCTYQNAATNYETTVEDIYPVDGGEDAYDVKVDFSMTGVTSHEQMTKLARYGLAYNALRRESYTVKVPIEHFTLSKGDRVYFVNDSISVGIAQGYIKSYDSDTMTITIDQELPASPDVPETEYGICVTSSDGVKVYPCIIDEQGTNIRLLLDEAPAIAPTAGMMYAYGELGSEVLDCIIKNKEIERTPGLAATLTLVPYAPEIFNADTQPIPPFNANISTAQLDINKINEGTEAAFEDINGSTIRDDGLVHFTFDPQDKKPDGTGFYNYGSAKENCDAVIVGSVINELDDYSGIYGLRANGTGYIKFPCDVAFYGTFSIPFFLKGFWTSGNKECIFDYYDPINFLFFSACIDTDGHLKITYQGLTFDAGEFNVLFSSAEFGSHCCLTFDYSSSILYLYIDQSLVYSNNFTKTYDDEGLFTDSVTFDDEGLFTDVVTYDDEGEMLYEFQGTDRTCNLYVLSDHNGANQCSLTILDLHVYTMVLQPSVISKLYQQIPLFINTQSQSMYYGKLKKTPENVQVYSYFEWNDTTTPYFTQGELYRKNDNRWELLKLEDIA